MLLVLQLWQYTLELKEDHWNLLGVPSYSQFFEAQLAACKPLELPELTVPLHPPGVAPSLPFPEVQPLATFICTTVCSQHSQVGLLSCGLDSSEVQCMFPGSHAAVQHDDDCHHDQADTASCCTPCCVVGVHLTC